MTQLLRFQRVVLRRGGRLLFDGLDLELVRGEALHLSGPNGSGKSSLIRLAAGLLRPDSGRVDRSDAALADDNHALDPELPLRRALDFWGKFLPSGHRLDAAMDRMDLAELAQVPVRLLSSGQAKRAALARVIVSGSPLWLLDEPLNGLDAGSVERLHEAITQHLGQGGAVVAASHLPLAREWRRLELGA